MIHSDFQTLHSTELFAIPGFLEAENNRYGPTAFMLLPLSNGRIAVLGSMRSLHAICDTLEEALEASKSIPMNVWRQASERKPSSKVFTLPQGKELPGLSLEDLGI